MSVASMRARPVRTTSTTVAQWVEDTTWHRRMYRQSSIRWTGADAFRVATRFTRGRVSFETPQHLQQLEAQMMELREYRGQIRDAMASRIAKFQSAAAGRSETVRLGLELMGLDEREAKIIVRSAKGKPVTEATNHDVRRTLRGYRYANPLIDVWELRQVEAMYDAADHLLEGAWCDLAEELGDRLGWDVTAGFTTDPDGTALANRVRWCRESPSSPALEQRYPALPAVRLADDF